MNDEMIENILKERYYQKDEHSWNDIAFRVAEFIGDDKDERYKFFDMISRKQFIPNSPCLFNAGTPRPQMSACFTVPVHDSIESIFEAVKTAAIIHASGGGTGFNFSEIRPKGSLVKGTGHVASGVVSFMKVFNSATETIKQGGCIDSNSRIQTLNGFIKIGELVDCPPFGNSNINNEVLDKNGYVSTSLSLDNGISDVLVIKTKNGYTLKCTPDHKIRIVDDCGRLDWKCARHITNDDYLVIKRGNNIVEKCVRLPEPIFEDRHFNTRKDTIVPKYLDEDLALLVGMYIANGSINGSRFIISIGDVDHQVKDEYKRIMQRYNLNYSEQKKPNDNSVNYFVSSIIFTDWWKSCQFNKISSLYARVPEYIFKSPYHVVCNFIKGLFSCDGHVHGYGYPMFTSSSKELVYDVQLLLLSIGMFSMITVQEKCCNSYGKNPMYSLRISDKHSLCKFKDDIKFIQDRKNDKLKSDISAHGNILPNINELLYKYYSPAGGRDTTSNPKFAREIERYIREDRHPNRERIVEICNNLVELDNNILQEDLLDKDFIFSKVDNVSEDKCYTVDIETLSGEYVANGICIHNKRRGANLGALDVDHKDIMEFIKCKENEGDLSNFNISVNITDDFMNNLEKPENKIIWDTIIDGTWTNGEPGIIFSDTSEKDNTCKHLGNLKYRNPCQEFVGLENECCTLGSINLVSCYYNNKFNYDKLNDLIESSIIFLDKILDKNMFPTEEIKIASHKTRKIGLGVMGLADLFILLDLKYGSDESLKFTKSLFSIIREIADIKSTDIARYKGTYPETRGDNRRNASVLSIAPTGSISLFAGVSSGIEPNFSYVYNRSTWVSGEKKTYLQIHPIFEEYINENYDTEQRNQLIETMMNEGSIQSMDNWVKENTKKLFVTAKDIHPLEHIKIQSSIQKHVDQAISKTINCKHETTKEDISDYIKFAWKSGCKGLTIYREGSRKDVVLEGNTLKEDKKDHIVDANNPIKQKIINANGRILPKTPRRMAGTLAKIESGCGTLLMAIGESDNKPHTVIVENLGGGCESLQRTVVKLVALALRWGIPSWDILHVLNGEKCPVAIRNPKSEVKSCAAALGMFLSEVVPDDEIPNKYEEQILDKSEITTHPCPDCGKELIFVEGCRSCQSCGYTKCSG